jgi:TetR/AcrR family transcriptional repressor of nem operon
MSTRQEIIERAMLLLKQTGYHGWSYAHISKMVGIRKASIHHHFPKKEDLISEILKIYINEIFSKLDEVARSEVSNYKKLEKLIESYQASYYSPNEICLCTILASDYQMIPEEAAQQLREFYVRLDQWICGVLKQGIAEKEFAAHTQVEPLASVILNVLQGLLITSKISANKESFELCRDYIYSILKC